MTYENVMRMATRQWGDKAQLLKTIEELGELQAAIAKYLLFKSNKNQATNEWLEGELIANMIEEYVDVEIMVDQGKVIFGRQDKLWDMVKSEKFRRVCRMLQLQGVDVR